MKKSIKQLQGALRLIKTTAQKLAIDQSCRKGMATFRRTFRSMPRFRRCLR